EATFRSDMREFERRAREQGLSPEEVERTYRQISRLMEAEPPNLEHVRMAREIMHHCAHPNGVVQGRAGTCSVASLEAQTYMRNPSAAAELVADVALSGRYMTADGHPIVVTPDMVQRSEHPPEERGQASEIFQVTAVNIQYQRLDPNLRYAQTESGEQVYSVRGGYPTTVWTRAEAAIDGHSVGVMDVPRTEPDFVGDDIVEVAGQIRGNRHEATVLESAEAARITGDSQTSVIDDERELRQTLSTLRREGRLPASVAVHTGNEPFFTDSGGGDAGGSGAWHVVTITDYDEATGRVSIDNQWNPAADRQGSRAVDVQDLHHAMQAPGSEQTIADLQQRRQTEDTALELLRQRHAAHPPQISDSDFNRQLGRQLNDHLDWDPEGQDEMWARYRNVLLPMSESDRGEVLAQIEDSRLRQRVADHLHAEDERRREIDRAMMAARSASAEREPAGAAAFEGMPRFVDASTFGAGGDSGATVVNSPAAGQAEQTIESLLAETETIGGDRGHRGDRAGRREESETHDSRREAASEVVSPDAVRDRSTERHADAATDTLVAGYHGEIIRRDVEPATHTMRADETVEDIARAHLQGTGATEEEIAAHAREINEINGGFVMEGQELILPGHTADGGFVTRGAEGSRQTSWADGVVRINNADGTGWVRRPSADGGMTEHHWGPNSGDNFDLTRTPDGRYRLAEAGHEARDIAHPETDVRVQRSHLEELLDSRCGGPNDRTARIRDDMREFERRAREQHLSEEEIARTYAEVSRLLQHDGDRPLDAAQRLNVAEQVLHQAAHPQTIDQGNHSTCGAAASESRMYTRHPSDAARLVADVATTGQFTTHGTPQRTVTIDPRILQPGREEQGNPTRDGERSQASQIFESTFVTLALDSRTTPPGQLRYEQREPHAPPPDDTGEWIVDSSTTPPRETRFDGLLTSDLPRTEELITGRHEAPHVFERAGDGPATVHFNSEEELRARLTEAQVNGQMPVVIWVDSMNEPFRTDSGGGSAGGSGEGHFVTVTSYDAEHNLVSIDNQWGDAHDHTLRTEGGRTVDRRMSTSDLFTATAPHDLPERIANAEATHRQIDQDRERGIYDGRREVAALLMDRIALRVTPEEFDRRLVDLARASRQRWARSGEASPGERERTEEAYRQVIAHIRQQDPARAEALERSMAAAAA
ncbi:MAG TPA: hypothetical protein V6D08_02235, partial [Candidatus Obscuribacterales bacterium]